MLQALVALLLPHSARGKALEPAFALAGQPVTLHASDVESQPLTCVSAFGREPPAQAVFASTLPDASLRCTVLPPEAAQGQADTAAVVSLMTRSSDKKGPQVELRHRMRFVQPPTLRKLQFQYTHAMGEHARLVLGDVQGLHKVKLKSSDFMLVVDATRHGLGELQVPAAAYNLAQSSAVLVFKLDQHARLPEASLRCRLLLGAQVVPLGEHSSQTGLPPTPDLDPRSEDMFNASDAAIAAPMAAPDEAPPMWLRVQRPLVQLVQPFAAADAALNGDSDAPGALVAEVASGVFEAAQSFALLFEVACAAPPGDGSVKVLPDTAPELLPYAVVTRELAADVDDADGSSPIELAVPSEEDCDAGALTRVAWPQGVAAQRLLLDSDVSELQVLLQRGLTVRIVGADGARVHASARWARVSEAAPAAPAFPQFSTGPPQRLYRGSTATVTLQRSGTASEWPSTVGWEVFMLPMVVPKRDGDAPPDAPDAVYAAHHPSGVLAAAFQQGAYGVAVWSAGITGDAAAFTVALNWAEVPYAAEWRLVVRLFALGNAALADGAEAAPAAQIVVSGAERDVCAPGTQRIQGRPVAAPITENATVAADATGALLGFYAAAGSGASAQSVPLTPPYRQHGGTYQLALPHDSGAASLVFLSRFNVHASASGCGSEHTALVWGSAQPVPRVDDATLAAAWALPDSGGACQLSVLVCPSSEACAADDPGTENFTVSVLRLLDPALAQVSAVHVAVGSGPAQPICTAGAAAATCAAADTVRVPRGAAPPHGSACELAACDEQGVLRAALAYRRGERVRIAVTPAPPPGGAARLAIGHRIFHIAEGASHNATVGFELFDEYARLSPFVPFFVRSRSATQVVLDVPISLTLADQQTSRQLQLELHITVLKLEAAQPNRAQRPMGALPAAPDPTRDAPLLPHGGVAEPLAADVTFASAAPVVVVDVGPRTQGRALLDDTKGVRASGACQQCPAGTFSYSVDTSPCLRCRPGTSAARTGMTACNMCPQGTYAAVYGAVACSPCVHGSYAAHAASSACRLCPLGFTTTSDGAAVCDKRVAQTVQVGEEYVLSVMFSLRLIGANIELLPARTGVHALPQDILHFLVSLDTAWAFNVSTSDVIVTKTEHIASRQLRVNMTANLAVHVPPHGTSEQRERAFRVAGLSKDAGIEKLAWVRTTEAFGSNVTAYTERDVRTAELAPTRRRARVWTTIVLPVLAGLIILGSAVLLRIRVQRPAQAPQAPQELAELRYRTPSEVLMGSLSFVSASIEPLVSGLRRSSYLSNSEGSDCDDVEAGPRRAQARKRNAGALDASAES